VRVFNVVEDRMRSGQSIPRRQNLEQIPVGTQEGGQSLIGGGTRRVITSSMVFFDRDALEGTTLRQLADYAAMRVFAQTRDASGENAPHSILSLFDEDAVPPKVSPPSTAPSSPRSTKAIPTPPAWATYSASPSRCASRWKRRSRSGLDRRRGRRCSALRFEDHMNFYARVLLELVETGKLDPGAPTLVVAGGAADRQALQAAGFSNVTISNLESMGDRDFSPYRWAHIDGERIDMADDSIEQVVEHMGLHHCASPHKALLEMYRVASRAVVAFENRDSLAIRAAIRLGLSAYHELDAVRINGLTHGGIRNGPVPNYVYRWTEREVKKTLGSGDPAHEVPVRFFYDTRFPGERAARLRGARRLAIEAARLPYAACARLFPRQSNVFGFFVDKAARRRRPWMNEAATGLNAEWASSTRNG
jgi:hypothetical protein